MRGLIVRVEDPVGGGVVIGQSDRNFAGPQPELGSTRKRRSVSTRGNEEPWTVARTTRPFPVSTLPPIYYELLEI